MPVDISVEPRNSIIAAQADIYSGPAGTPVPTTLNEALDAGLERVGATGDKGVGLNWSETLKKFYNHQSLDVYRISKDSRDISIDLLLNEQTTLSRQIAYGGGTAAGSADPDAGVSFLLAGAGDVDERVYVIDLYDGEVHERWVIRRGIAGGAVKSQFARTDIADLPVNITCLSDGTNPAIVPISNAPGMVTTAAVSSVTRSPTTKTLAADATWQATATAVFADGSSLDVTNLATWASATPSHATVDSHGLITAVATGTANITATYRGVASSAIAVTVS